MREDQYRQYLDMMNQWLILKQEGKSVDRYLAERNYRVIALYGMSVYARHVIRELRGSNILIAYGIDRKKKKPYQGVEILQPTDRLPRVDVILNTVLQEQEEIAGMLSHVTEAPVVSLADVVFGSYA